MPTTTGNTFCLFSPLLKVDEDAMVTQNQGTISVLGSDSTQTKAGSTTSSLRRTLSADMSPSSKLLSQSTFSPMKKKIVLSEELEIAVPDEDQERQGQEDVWRMIQSQKKIADNEPGGGGGGRVDVWGSILADKDKEDGSKSPAEPYIPSVMKRSTSCPLSEKSLEICTESLGSETGSDVFSSRPPSESGDAEEENDVKEEAHGNDLKEEVVHQVVPKCNFSTNKKSSSTRSFPPPLPSLPRPDAPSLLMKPHREKGRLVLQAVPIPSQNCFHAARQDGRLLLTFAGKSNPEQVDDDDKEQQLFEMEQDYQDETDEEEEADDEGIEKETVIVMEQVPEKYTSDVTKVHSTIIGMKNVMRLDNRKAKWNTPQNSNISVNYKGVTPTEEEEEEIHHPIPQSLPWPLPVARSIPSPPPPAAATSFNAYEYFWRAKSTTSTAANSTNFKNYSVLKKNNKVQLSHNLVENRADYLLPLFKGCKEEPRTTRLAREPYSIATS